ncbi:DEAD/DEAH box helicase family protein [Nocardiopsis sediminis]|uniref:DEAD/DEAH box helicase family protein n=1 Tax=Nocardiopsis sediminis TaxID=1778267 RepID=A0ABV8FQ14_9ACTN
MTDSTGRIAAARPPVALRRYQHQGLEALARRWAGGDRRAWVVLPPGAGKTLVGLEAARRLGRPVVVFTPNTAIQGQWAAQWRAFTRPEGCTAGTARTMEHDVTVLTYQSLAVFDPDAETDEEGHALPLVRRLHGNGADLVESLYTAGPLTIVLDECHHLLQTWGRLLAEVLSGLPDAHVIGLTGTPAATLSSTDAALVATLFGAPIHGASIPALVRDGHLAPFAELVWATEPTPVERDYIADQGIRFTELCTDLLSPGFSRTDFLPWLRRRFEERLLDTGERLAWGRLAAEEPGLTDAVLRLHHAGLSPLPPDARMLERHRRAPDAADWMALLGDYVTHCLRADPEGPDEKAIERIRTALPAVGYTLTKRGIRTGRSPVDRVLARSRAKAQGAVEIAAAESASLGPRLRALVLCDHERATARPSARLRDVIGDHAGSAWSQLELLAADPRTRDLNPMLVTGRTVAAGAHTAADFTAFARDRRPGLELSTADGPADGLVRIEGRWSSRTWVRLVTAYLESGACRVLVGTRALLGEGWDARGVNTVIDLTTATTPTAVVQGRGRALRLDPAWPDKTAHTWTVVCVSDAHPKGGADWDRFVRKHEGYLGVAADGEVMSGVAHVDPALSPYAPPPVAELDALNARMLARAEDRGSTRERWRIGLPYTDELLPTLRVRAARRAPAAPVPSGRAPEPPAAVPAVTGISTGRRPGRRPTLRSVPAGAGAFAAVLGVAGPVLGLPPFVPTASATLLGVLAERTVVRRSRTARAARLVEAASGEPDLVSFGYAVADALKGAGHSSAGAEGVRLDVDSDGTLRLTLTGAGPQAAGAFTTALDELISPLVGTPRYIVPRYTLPVPENPAAVAAAGRAWLRDRAPANAVVFHAVPALLARNRTGAEAFTTAWNRWISTGETVYTASSAGARLLYSHYATDPYPAETATRLTWE